MHACVNLCVRVSVSVSQSVCACVCLLLCVRLFVHVWVCFKSRLWHSGHSQNFFFFFICLFIYLVPLPAWTNSKILTRKYIFVKTYQKGPDYFRIESLASLSPAPPCNVRSDDPQGQSPDSVKRPPAPPYQTPQTHGNKARGTDKLIPSLGHVLHRKGCSQSKPLYDLFLWLIVLGWNQSLRKRYTIHVCDFRRKSGTQIFVGHGFQCQCFLKAKKK